MTGQEDIRPVGKTDRGSQEDGRRTLIVFTVRLKNGEGGTRLGTNARFWRLEGARGYSR